MNLTRAINRAFPPSRDGTGGRLGVALAAAPAAYWLPAASAISSPFGNLLGIRSHADSGGPLLSFDDGPHRYGTPAVLELLRDANVTATFFLVGEQVERLPALASEIASAGHQIALHCHRHRCLLRLTPKQVCDDLRRAEDAIVDATSIAPREYRPPYGILNAAALALAHMHRLQTTLWSNDGRDWQRRATGDSIAQRVTRNLQVRDVVLLHDADHYCAPDSWQRTVAALPQILEAVQQLAAAATLQPSNSGPPPPTDSSRGRQGIIPVARAHREQDASLSREARHEL